MMWCKPVNKELPLGVAWEADAIRVVELHKNSNNYQVGAKVFPLPKGTLENGELRNPRLLADFLQSIKADNNWGKKRVVTAIPGKQAVLRHIKLPRMSPEDLNKAVIWEAKQFLGLDEKEYSIDYMVLGDNLSKSAEQLTVLLGAIPRRMALDFYELFFQADFKLDAIDVAPLALKRALVDHNMDGDTKGAILLDLGNGFSQLAIVSQGQLSFARTLSFCLPEQEKTKGKDNLMYLKEAQLDENIYRVNHKPQEKWDWLAKSKELLKEIRRSLDYFQTQCRDMLVGQVIVSGSGSAWPGLELLVRDLGLEVQKAIPGTGLFLDQHPDPSFALALGLALKGVRE